MHRIFTLFVIFLVIGSCRKDPKIEVIITDVEDSIDYTQDCPEWELRYFNLTNDNHLVKDIAVNSLGHIFVITYFQNTNGTYSTLIRSTDNGNNWVDLFSQYGADLAPFHLDIFENEINLLMRNGNECHACKSYNNGDTWDCGYSVPTNNLTYKQDLLEYISADTGYMATYSGLSKTVDGGIHWNSVPEFSNYDIRGVEFLSANVGYTIEQELCRKTNDGGFTWDTVFYENAINLKNLSFYDSSNGLITGSKTYKTTDGGNTWTPLITTPSSLSIGHKDANTFYVVTIANTLMVSKDGGASWTDVCGIETFKLSVIEFFNGNGYLGTSDYLLPNFAPSILILE